MGINVSLIFADEHNRNTTAMNTKQVTIRTEKPGDYKAITLVNDLAFGQKNEGILVEKLRKKPGFIPGLSLVAELEERIVGHILFFPIQIVNRGNTFPSLALAPMCVLPEYQKQGIGTRLANEGFAAAKSLGFNSVIVLGHENYYPRLGFEQARKWNIRAPFDIPTQYFFAMELVPGALNGVSGTVQYPDEFADVE